MEIRFCKLAGDTFYPKMFPYRIQEMTDRHTTMNILYQFDEAYSPYAGVSLTSLFINHADSPEINVYILGEALSSCSVSRFQLLAKQYGRKITFLNSDRILRKIRELGIPKYRGSFAANMKLFFSSEIEEKVERLLYIDSDTLITGPLEPLFHLSMKEYPLAMALDSLGEKHKRYIGLQKMEPYFNSGVILFNLKKWRELDCEKLLAEHALHSRSHYMSPDQDLLNVVFKNKILCINLKYNFQPIHYQFDFKYYSKIWGADHYYTEQEVTDAFSDIRIMHFFRFAGDFPWNIGSVHPYTDAFNHYLSLSFWKNLQRSPSQKNILFSIEKWLYRHLSQPLFLMIFKFSYELFIYRSEQDSKKKRNNHIM